MARNRKLNVQVYPEEREGRVKDANKKLKSQVRQLKKQLKQLETQNKTLQRAFNKSCDFIQSKLENKSIKEILNMINSFDHKETERGREKQAENKPLENKCPKCDKKEKQGYSIMHFNSVVLKKCECGYEERVKLNEGIERS